MDSEFLNAYLLHQRPYTDSQVMLDMLVEEQGLRRVLARVKGPKSLRLKAELQPFRLLSVKLAGRGDLKYLNQLDQVSTPLPFKGKALYCGFYINELTQKIVPFNEPLDHLYDLYHLHINELLEDRDFESTLRRYEFELLEQMGLAINFYEDLEGEAIEEQTRYQYLPELGWQVIESTQRGVQGSQILAMGEGRFTDPATRYMAKQLSRYILRPLLGYKELKSKELFTV